MRHPWALSLGLLRDLELPVVEGPVSGLPEIAADVVTVVSEELGSDSGPIT